MNPLNLLDPKYGGHLRALIALLSAAVALLTSPAVADLGWTWLMPVVASANAVLSMAAHFTPLGNKP